MARAAPADKVHEIEWQEAERDYQNLKEEHASAADLPLLTEAEEDELKTLFRRAVKLCQLEPHGHFFTRDHRYVVIDNECMFHAPPCLNEYEWFDELGVRPVITELCRKFVRLSDSELHGFTALPENYSVANLRDLFKALLQARTAAHEYLEIFDD